MTDAFDLGAVTDAHDADLRAFVAAFLRYDTTDGNEAPAQAWIRERFDDFGFDVYEWTADAAELADHPSFPDDPDEIAVADRPSIGGVFEFGDPDRGPTLVLNGHADVVPVERGSWTSDPFEPTWRDPGDWAAVGDGSDAGTGDWRGETLTARGAVDMKSGLSACVFAATHLRDLADDGRVDLDGRIVVESVVGEEEGGIGAASAALSNPYPFERDAAVVAEPTELRAVTACEGTVMKRLEIRGRSAHAATRWRGESVLPHFQRIHDAFFDLEADRAERVTHPLYEDFETPWPITFGVVHAGSWASSVPAHLEAEIRLGVAPGETVDEVEAEYEARLREVVDDSDWLSTHPPTFERFSIMFEPAEIDPAEPVVLALQGAMNARDLDPAPTGATYGADQRHYVQAGVPTVVFGPGSIEQAHFPDETVEWRDVLTATATLADAANRFLGGA